MDNKDFNLTNDSLDYIIKEITCYPITIDIIKKTNDILLKEITDSKVKGIIFNMKPIEAFFEKMSNESNSHDQIPKR